ncbi:hypothetical protein RQP46_003796 [Phenoliferia psychrophenolica]
MLSVLLLACVVQISLAFPNPLAKPSVATADGTTWVGKTSADASVDSFLGMPFALPPIGDLRFAPPQPPATGFGTFDASSYGASCPQANPLAGADPQVLSVLSTTVIEQLSSTSIFNMAVGGAEDCLTINIYGGAFSLGGTSTYDGSSLIQRSVAAGSPIIFVSVNYRLNSFGFLPGQEVANDPTTSCNAGLLDQRLGMKWTNKYIGAFGGDKDKVTIMGESAGSISVAFHNLAAEGKYARVPVINGDQYDVNMTTTAHVDSWLKTVLFPNSTAAQRARILELYDMAFQAETQDTWSYASRVFRGTPLLAPTAEIQSRYIAFVNNLDPNVEGYLFWPKYGKEKNLMQFTNTVSSIIPDTYREAAMAYWVTIVDVLTL